ncbi:hypothetical protein QUW36_16385, partial [Clostridium cadaveris]
TKIDGIEIGGRNLIKDSKGDFDLTINASGLKLWALCDTSIFLGKIITLSFYAKSSNGSNKVYMSLATGSSTRTNITNNITIPSNYKKFTFTFTATTDSSIDSFMIVYGTNWHSGNSGAVSFKNFKLELGNKATDWTPAPEDVDQAIADVITTTDTKISKAKSDIKIETDKIALNVSNLTAKTSTIETQLGDKATKAEVKTVSDKAASIEANLNGITQRVSSTESTVRSHTTQIGAVDGKINTAKTDAISTASADATTKANNALKDGKAYTDNGLAPVNKTLATHTIEISTTKQQVSTIETNLGSITSRVSTVENKTTTIDGKVKAQETRISTAEQKITPSSIVNSVSSGISNGTTLDITSIKLEKNLFTVKNSMFRLYDTYGDLALSSGGGWTYAQGGLQAAVAPHNKPNVRGITLSSGNAGIKPYGITHESFNNLPFTIGSNTHKVEIRNMIDTEWGNIEAKSIFGNDVYSNHAEGNYSQLIRNELNSRNGDGILWLNYLTDSVSTSQVVIGAGDMGNWGKISANSLYVK